MHIHKIIDHTALAANTDAEAIHRLCNEAIDHEFASVCVNPHWVQLAANILSGSDVKVCTVVGFPLGATHGAVKSLEATTAAAFGAQEVDMVINVGALKSKDFETVREEIMLVRGATRGLTLKVIVETGLLTDYEIIRACKIAEQQGADFVKTSTGFSPAGGATAEHVRLMRQCVSTIVGIKASGGIRTRQDAIAMIKAGATRLGCSASVAIVSDPTDENEAS